MCSLGTRCGCQATEVQLQHLSGWSISNFHCCSYFPLGGTSCPLMLLAVPRGRPSCRDLWSMKAKCCPCCPCSSARSQAHGDEDTGVWWLLQREEPWPAWGESRHCHRSWGTFRARLEGCATSLSVSCLVEPLASKELSGCLVSLLAMVHSVRLLCLRRLQR